MDTGAPEWTPEMRKVMEKVLPKDVTGLIKSLIPMLASQAFIYMGRVDNPLLGHRTRDLAQAHLAIDCSVALLEKVDPFLTADERSQLRGMGAELQMQYVEERQKGE